MSRKDHSERIKRLCLLCLNKCDDFPLSPKSKETIIKFNIYQELERDGEWLPQSQCRNCQRVLSSLHTPEPRALPPLPDYEKLVKNVKDNQRVKTLRGGEEKPCSCELCRLGSIPKKGPVVSEFLAIGPPKKKPGRPSMNPDAPECVFCGKKGFTGHDCSAEKIIKAVSEETCEVIASEIIKGKMIKIDSKDVLLKSKLGRPLEICVKNCDYLLSGGSGSYTPTKPTISSVALMKIGSRLNISGRKLLEAGNILKEDMGAKLEPYFKNLIIKKGHELDEFFEAIEMDFEEYGGPKGKRIPKKVKKTMIFCKDIEWLLVFINQKRGYDIEENDDLLIKFGLDR